MDLRLPTHYLKRDLTDHRTGRVLFRKDQGVFLEGRPLGLVTARTPEGCRFVVSALDLTRTPPPAVLEKIEKAPKTFSPGDRIRIVGTKHTGVVNLRVGETYYYTHDKDGQMYFCPVSEAQEIKEETTP